jgi:hypothetical protein
MRSGTLHPQDLIPEPPPVLGIVTWSINLNFTILYSYYGPFTLDVKLLLNENLGGILGVTQC